MMWRFFCPEKAGSLKKYLAVLKFLHWLNADFIFRGRFIVHFFLNITDQFPTPENYKSAQFFLFCWKKWCPWTGVQEVVHVSHTYVTKIAYFTLNTHDTLYRCYAILKQSSILLNIPCYVIMLLLTVFYILEHTLIRYYAVLYILKNTLLRYYDISRDTSCCMLFHFVVPYYGGHFPHSNALSALSVPCCFNWIF